MKFKELVLEASGWAAGQFSVKVRDRVHVPQVVSLDLDAWSDHLSGLEAQALSLEELCELGEALSAALIPDGPIRLAFLSDLDGLGENEGLRIRLFLEGRQLANLPWEYMWISRNEGAPIRTSFLALNKRVSVVRDEASEKQIRTLQSSLPLSIGFGFASPRQEKRLNMQKERDVIENALEGNDIFALSINEALSAEEIQAFTDDLDIFHFAGHGTHQEVIKDGEVVGQDYLLLQDADRNKQEFEADRLANNLSNAKLVFLGACDTGRRDGENVWSSTATVLMEAGIPAVVGMQYEITNISEGKFAEAFYTALSKGKSVDEAVIAGRITLGNQLDVYEQEWGIPVLYMRDKTGVLFGEALKQENEEAKSGPGTGGIKIKVGDNKDGGEVDGVRYKNKPVPIPPMPGLNINIDVGTNSGAVRGVNVEGGGEEDNEEDE